jgi:YjbE family integral membrane protein
MADIVISEALGALLQVIIIDLALAGDNAVVIGLAAAGLPPEQRNRVIIIGVLAATALRIIFAGIATQLLQVLGLLLAGGLVLLWVCWKMWRELRAASRGRHGADVTTAPRKTFNQAALQIIVTDVSLSLDNVLAVAGAARDHPFVLVFGLLLSVPLMAIGANLLARLLQRQPWLGYLGLAVILYVAGDMIYRGAHELTPVIASVVSIFS